VRRSAGKHVATLRALQNTKTQLNFSWDKKDLSVKLSALENGQRDEEGKAPCRRTVSGPGSRFSRKRRPPCKREGKIETSNEMVKIRLDEQSIFQRPGTCGKTV
jgi:hypothetical protein